MRGFCPCLVHLLRLLLGRMLYQTQCCATCVQEPLFPAELGKDGVPEGTLCSTAKLHAVLDSEAACRANTADEVLQSEESAHVSRAAIRQRGLVCMMQDSTKTTVCGWKGTSNYKTIVVSLNYVRLILYVDRADAASGALMSGLFWLDQLYTRFQCCRWTARRTRMPRGTTLSQRQLRLTSRCLIACAISGCMLVLSILSEPVCE